MRFKQVRAATHTPRRLLTARSLLCLVALTATLLASLASPPRAHADVITPQTVRYHTVASGDIAFVANSNMICPNIGTDKRCSDASNGVDRGDQNNLNNNSYPMVFWDFDLDTSTVNSTSAALTLPEGGSVLFAGLYWGGMSNEPTRNTVKFKVPGAATYQTLTGTLIGRDPSTNAANPGIDFYHVFYNATSLVQAAGAGNYSVANILGSLGRTDTVAAWNLVVVYTDPDAPPRDLTVIDGFVAVRSSSPPIEFTVSGFQTPPSGPITSRLGVFSYEGDRGIEQDQLKLNDIVVTNGLNPPNNFFNSTISRTNSNVTTTTPNTNNNFGIDADIVDTPPGALTNGATQAKITLLTAGDSYYPSVLTFVTDIYDPVVKATKTVVDQNGGTVRRGDVLRYLVNVTNSGQDAAVNTVLTDAIPANTTYVPSSLEIVSGPNSGSKTDIPGFDQAEFIQAAPARVVFRLGSGANATQGGTLAANSGTTTISFDVVVNANVADATVITNQAQLSFAGATTGHQLTQSSNPVSVTTVVQADLRITKTDGLTTVTPGNPISYTIVVTNDGPDNVVGAVVSDPVPAEIKNVSITCTATPGSSCTTPGGPLRSIQAAVSLLVNGSVTFTVSGTVAPNAAGTLTNTATVAPPVGISDPNPANNQATDVTTITPRADLAVTKTLDNPGPNAGETVNFTVLLRNNGPSDATGVTLTDQLPPQVTFVSATPSQGTYSSATGVWTVGALAANSEATLRIAAQVNPGTPPINFTNTAAVSGANQPDPITTNNQDSVSALQPVADLAVTKTVIPASPNVGTNVTFSISVTNNGPAAAPNVVARDILPTGLDLVSATPSRGTINPANGVWTIGNMPSGDVVTLTIVATAVEAGPMLNVFGANSPDVIDPNLDNNTVEVPLNAQLADLAVTKVADVPNPPHGSNVTYTITITNNGPSDASGIVLGDQLAYNQTFISALPSQGSFDSATWTVGGLAAGGSATLLLTVRQDNDNLATNTATITAAEQPDLDPTNNQASVTVYPPPDLVIVKTDDFAIAELNDIVTYYISVGNLSDLPAPGVVITETVPANTIFYAAGSTGGWSCADGSPAGTRCTFNYGTIGLRGLSAITFSVRVLSTIASGTSSLTNTTTVDYDGSRGPDTDPSNNTSTVVTPFDPTAVTLVSFRAAWTGAGIALQWSTATELETRSFRLYRGTDRNRARAVLVTEVAARGVGGRGAEYAYTDTGVQRGVVYTYWLEEVETGGAINPLASRVVQPYQLMLPAVRR